MASTFDEVSDIGFFKWFVSTFPHTEPWTVGKGHAPFEFEAENVAQRVREDARKEIWEKAAQGAINLGNGKVPWCPAPDE